MPNHVTNRLEIHCEDKVTMDKIKMMIFDEDEKNERIFTMEKMLPIPARFSGRNGYNDYGYDWCCTIWGTKWDAYDCYILESGDTITIGYQTAWNPNVNWLELLCLYIQTTISHLVPNERPNVSVRLQYHDYMGDFGGIFDWVPYKNPKRQRYEFMEYAKMHDKNLYTWAVEYDRLRRGIE